MPARLSAFVATVAIPFVLLLATAATVAQESKPVVLPPAELGPFVGAVTPKTALLWARVAAPGDVGLVVIGPEGSRRFKATADVERDLTVHWAIDGLEPDTRYEAIVTAINPKRVPETAGPTVSVSGAAARFRTPSDPLFATSARLVFGSCANDLKYPDPPIFRTILKAAPDAFVMLGDTPYIDSTDLTKQRLRYRAFYAQAGVAALLQRVPTYGTWDDHDFGKNDTNGLLAGRENSRRAFLEYHANPYAGIGDDGVFTRFRVGPIDVFLLDTRWFSWTERSFADQTKPTLLGSRQWLWLQRELKASTAPFKVLASGMIWNGAVRPGKTDYWGAYEHERAALFGFVAKEKINGIVLMGGDIHRSRVLKHGPKWADVGYPLYEFVSSPLAADIIKEAAAPEPDLVFDGGEAFYYVALDADVRTTPAKLTGRVMTGEGKEVFKVETNGDLLTPK